MMNSNILRTARNRYQFRHVLSAIVLLAIIYGITRNEVIVLGLTISFLLTQTVRLLQVSKEEYCR